MKETDVGRTCEGPLDAPKNEWARDVVATPMICYRRDIWSVSKVSHNGVWQVRRGVGYVATFETFGLAVEYVERLIGARDVTLNMTGAYVDANVPTSSEDAAIRASMHRGFRRVDPTEGASNTLRNLILWVGRYGNVPAGTRVFYVRINGEERLTLVLPKGVK